MKPTTNDRIIIIDYKPEGVRYPELDRLLTDDRLDQWRNKPRFNELENYKYLRSYGFTVHAYNNWKEDKNQIGGYSGYLPFIDLDSNEFSLSGGGQTVLISDLKYIETIPAPYWNWGGNQPGAGKGVLFFKPAQHFAISFNDFKKL